MKSYKFLDYPHSKVFLLKVLVIIIFYVIAVLFTYLSFIVIPFFLPFLFPFSPVVLSFAAHSAWRSRDYGSAESEFVIYFKQ